MCALKCSCFLSSVVLSSSLVLFSACLFSHRDQGLFFTSARVLVRAPINGPGSQPIDTTGPHSVYSVLSCPRWLCNHRMCVSAERLGSKTWVFLGRLHIQVLRFFWFKPFTSLNHDPKHWRQLSNGDDCSRCVFQRNINAPPSSSTDTEVVALRGLRLNSK